MKLRELISMFKRTKPYDFQVVLERSSPEDKLGMTYKWTNGNPVEVGVGKHMVATTYR